MGQNKPQGIPEAVRVAQDVLQDLLPGLDEARAQALRKKLPAYALMLAQKEGQTPTAEALREAAFSLTGAFGRVAGGGALGFADYQRIRNELMIEKDNPWVAVIAGGDADGYMRLRREHTNWPRQIETWKFMLEGLAQVADPLPLLALLLRDNIDVDQIAAKGAPHPFTIVLAHFDRAVTQPEMCDIMRAQTNYARFPRFMAAQGRHDLLARLYTPAEFRAMDRAIVSQMLLSALQAGQRETAESMVQYAPGAFQNLEVLSAAVTVDWMAPVLTYIDGVQEGFQKKDLALRFMAKAIEAGNWNNALILERYEVKVEDAIRDRNFLQNIAAKARLEGLLLLEQKGYFRDVSTLVLAELGDIARRYNKPECRAVLEQALKKREGKTVQAAVPYDFESVKDWQLQGLRKALQEGAPAPVVTYLAVDIMGAARRQEGYGMTIHPADNTPEKPTEAAQAVARYVSSRGASHGLVGTLAQETGRLLEARNLEAGASSFGALLSVFKAVKDIVGERDDLPAQIVREVYAQSYDTLIGNYLSQVVTVRGLQARDMTKIFADIDILSPRIVMQLAQKAIESDRWLLLHEMIEGGHMDVIPAKRDEILANDLYVMRMRGAKAWDRIMPGQVLALRTLIQPVKNVRPALMQGVLQLIDKNRVEPAEAMAAAYKLCAVFRSEDRIMRYLERWGAKIGRDSLSILGMAQTIVLPEKAPAIDLSAWGDFVLRYGPDAGKLVSYADRIEAPTGSINEMREKAAQYHYKRGRENPALAAFCFRRNVSEEAHDQALTLLAQKAALATPRVQRIPDMSIDGAEFGMKGARFYRLKDDDFRGLFLGLLVDCCQHIDKGQGNANAAWCARHGFQSENGGFYVIETDEGEIIGETWAWRATGGQMVFDSLETLGKNMTDNTRVSKAQWSALMDRVKERLAADPGDITALMVGTDGQRCPLLNYNVPNAAPAPYAKALHPARPLDHKSYADSKEQYLFWAAEGYVDGPQAEVEGPVPEWVAPEQPAPAQPAPAQPAPLPPHNQGPGRFGLNWAQGGRLAMNMGPEPHFDLRRHPHDGVWEDDGGAPQGPLRRIRRGPGLLP